MPQGQKSLCLIQFWVVSFSPFSAPAPSFLSMQYKELGYYGKQGKNVENFGTKSV